MEIKIIKINVPRNTYRKPTEMREWVCQIAVDAFLRGSFFQVSNGCAFGVAKNDCVKIPRFVPKGMGGIPIHECEMRFVAYELRDKGWFLYRMESPSGCVFYQCSRLPSAPKGWMDFEGFKEEWE